MRYLIEYTWSGYKSSQTRVCHRVVVERASTVEWFKRVPSVAFSDGTHMSLSTRRLKPREKAQELHGYDGLFEKIFAQGLVGRIHVNQVL